MGVDISDIVARHPTSLKDHSGSIVAIDSYNVIYQFLSNIRQPDGTPLMDSQGRVTSHISGLFYRSVTFMENGIRPLYVFDGKPSNLKDQTIAERKLIKEKHIAELEEARQFGEEERIRSLSSRINYITREIIDDSVRLLKLMGLPVIMAPSEGEAEASVLNRNGLVNGVVSQDYDCLLFGAKIVFRNFVSSGRRKIPGKNFYVNISPEYLDLEETLRMNAITQEQLISIGIMVGTDFNKGLDRVGAKTALNLIRKYGNIKEILKAKGADIEKLDEIIDFFANPPSIEKPEIRFEKPDQASLVKYLCNERSFSEERILPYVEKIKDFAGSTAQSRLESFF
ncbi:MAG: flap endonuclease-1 [Thermoplasmata archaeon]